jgi:hypothetical protein
VQSSSSSRLQARTSSIQTIGTAEIQRDLVVAYRSLPYALRLVALTRGTARTFRSPSIRFQHRNIMPHVFAQSHEYNELPSSCCTERAAMSCCTGSRAMKSAL